jgi:DNA-binding MarR family transcriptional regulator
VSTDPPTQTLLFLAYQRSARELEDAIVHSGGHSALRPKYGAVFGQLDEHGTRATTLARGAGMTKAAMGQLIDELEHLGYVKRSVDPSDRRAKLVLPTAAALDVLGILADFNERWESRHRLLLGADVYESLRSSLQTIAFSPTGVQDQSMT